MFNKKTETNPEPIDRQLDIQLNAAAAETAEETKPDGIQVQDEKSAQKNKQSDQKVISVGEWMVTILVFLLPVVNIIMMAYWAFSSEGSVNRRNFSRACLLWIIILLIAYVVAMTVAGFTIMDIFVPKK